MRKINIFLCKSKQNNLGGSGELIDFERYLKNRNEQIQEFECEEVFEKKNGHGVNELYC